MQWDIVVIENENKEAFAAVLPLNMDLTGYRIALGAVSKYGKVYGAVSYMLVDHEYDIDWIYVEPQFRRNGIGTALMKEMLTAIEKSGDRFMASAKFEYTEDNNVMHTFFLSLEWMDVSYSHDRFYVEPEFIEGSGLVNHKKAINQKPVSFFKLPAVTQKKMLALLAARGEYIVTDYNRWRSEIVEELSRVILVGNEPVDLMFIRKDVNGNLSLDYLYSKYIPGLFDLLTSSAVDVTLLYPDSTLYYDTLDETALKITERFFPRAERVYIYEAVF